VENGVACDLANGILLGVCFALSEMGVEGAGGVLYVSGGARAQSGGDGAGATRQQVRWRGRGPVAGDDGGGGCTAKGAWVVVVCMEAAHACGVTGEWWGRRR
jgi:hypothetical protein